MKESGVGNTGWVAHGAGAPLSIITPAGSASGAGAAVWATANKAFFTRFDVSSAGAYRYVNWRCDVQSGNVQVGIVSLGSSTLLNFTLVASTGVIACPAAGNIRTDLSSFTLTPGEYAVFIWADNTTFQTRFLANSGLQAPRSFMSQAGIASGVQSSGTLAYDTTALVAVSVEANLT